MSKLEIPSLEELITIVVDDDGTWHRPEYPRYTQALAEAKPVLMASLDNNETIESVPSVKENQKISFCENVDVMCIENRFQLMDPAEFKDDDSYEIEIVEGNGSGGDDDADFYLEMIDGEIFYVFETEDDISVDSNDDSDSSYDGGDEEAGEPLQLDIGGMMAPVEVASPVQMGESFSQLAYDHSETSATSAGLPEGGEVGVEDVIQFELPLPPTHVESNPPHEALSPKSECASTVRADVAPSSPRRLPSLRDLGDEASPSPAHSPLTPPKSILRACPISPVATPRSSPRKEKKEKKPKKEKTFSKTFVRAADFDGEHRVYAWEKPTWANKQLKSTGKGDDIRSGGNLANPITNAAALIEKGAVKWEKPEWALNTEASESEDVNAKEKLIRQIQQGAMSLPNMGRGKSRLKLSINGSILATGGDIVKPITKATIIKKPSFNIVANPKILRATPGGSRLWNGENLEGPVTQATTMKKYAWEKPSWVSKKLQTTYSGEKIKAGIDVAAPTTSVEKKIEWEKPDWTKKRSIGRSASAQLDKAEKKEYGWQKPSWVEAKLKPTGGNSFDKGRSETLDLARPITDLPDLAKGRPRTINRSKSTD